MYCQQPAIEMRLHAVNITMCEVLTVEVNLQALDCTFDAGAPFITSAVPGEVLGMVPVDLGKKLTVDPNVSALAAPKAGLCPWATGADRL